MAKHNSNTAPTKEPSNEAQEIQTTHQGATLKIVLDRPRNGNALTTSMVEKLVECFGSASRNKRVSRIVLTANGKFFCTGMDLSSSTTAVGRSKDAAVNEYKKFVGLFEAIDKCPKVTIACINGPCFAGGVGLAFACDIRLALRTASVTLSEVRLGLCPAIISKYVVRECGPAFTREAMLTGRKVAMGELQGLGAIHGLADDMASLGQLLDNYLLNLQTCAPEASAKCKRAVAIGWARPDSEEQNNVLQSIFLDMMVPGSEGSIGVANFQAGKGTMNWDDIYKSKL